MKKYKTDINRVNRLLIIAVVIISLSVVGFIVGVTINTGNMAEYMSDTYEDAYLTTLSAMKLKTMLHEAEDAMYAFTEVPDSPRIDTEAERLYENREARKYLLDILDRNDTVRASEDILNEFETIRALNDEIVSLSMEGKTEQAKKILSVEALPVYAQLNAELDAVIDQGTHTIENNVVQSNYLSQRTDMVAGILGATVIVVTLFVTIFSARAISKQNEKIYRNDLLFNVLAENIDDVFKIMDFDSNEIEYISNNMERILGFSPQEYRDDPNILLKFVEKEEDFYKLYNTYINMDWHDMQEYEYTIRHEKTGELREIRTQLYPVLDHNNKLRKMIVLSQDITNDKKAQAALVDALNAAEHANMVKRDFLSRISHDLRTPINAIIGMKTIAEMNISNKEKVEDCLGKIGDASGHLLDMVTDVLDMSRLEMGKMKLEYKPFQLDGMINRIFSIVYPKTEEKKQHFTVDMSGVSFETLVGDEMRIRQIILNLLTNAVKFTQENGTIKLQVKQYGYAEGYVNTRFVVRDNGMGIRKEFLEKLFLPFEQDDIAPGVKQEGVGLGLPICKNLATQMDGDIAVQSQEGKGSEFVFELRIQAVLEEESDVSGQEKKTKPPVFNFAGKRALAVEDNDINREIIEELLKAVGFTVDSAENGAQALEYYEKMPGYYYDVVMMDVRMPVMDGNEAAKRIRESAVEGSHNIPIIAMTANIRPESVGESLSCGMTAYITKPIDRHKMYEIIHDSIENRENVEGERDGTI